MGASTVSAYAQLQVRVRVQYSRLLTPQRLQELMQVENFEALLSSLLDTAYAPYLEKVDRSLLTPRRVVYQLRCRLAASYEKLIKFTPDPGHQLLMQLWSLYEVDNLKATLRGIEHQSSWEQVLYLLSPGEKYWTVTFDKLQDMMRSDDIATALEVLRGTLYYEPLAHALNRYQDEESLFPLEAALDLDYYRELWKSMQQLTGNDRQQALRLIGPVIDKDNLLGAIRYRIYHRMSTQEIINYTLPFGYRVQDAHIRAIAAGEDIGAVVRGIYPRLLLAAVDFEAAPGLALRALEVELNRQIVRRCRIVFRGAPFHIGLPVAYLLLHEHEIENLTALIEAKDSRLPLEMIKSVVDFIPLDSQLERS